MKRLGTLIQEVIRADGSSKIAFARAMQLSPSQVSRALHDDNLPVATCFRLALFSGRSASLILRAAGHEEIASMLEQLYPAAAEDRPLVRSASALTPAEERLARSLSALPKTQQHVLTGILQAAIDGQAARRRQQLTRPATRRRKNYDRGAPANLLTAVAKKLAG
jgi:hypothetical protein